MSEQQRTEPDEPTKTSDTRESTFPEKIPPEEFEFRRWMRRTALVVALLVINGLLYFTPPFMLLNGSGVFVSCIPISEVAQFNQDLRGADQFSPWNALEEHYYELNSDGAPPKADVIGRYIDYNANEEFRSEMRIFAGDNRNDLEAACEDLREGRRATFNGSLAVSAVLVILAYRPRREHLDDSAE